MAKKKKIEKIETTTMTKTTVYGVGGDNFLVYVGEKGLYELVDKINELIDAENKRK